MKKLRYINLVLLGLLIGFTITSIFITSILVKIL